ncbi:MAG: fibronectin type III domain-containing protein [bacterium]|nr:fibronectin type III domain-containing protein [bacterium]
MPSAMADVGIDDAGGFGIDITELNNPFSSNMTNYAVEFFTLGSVDNPNPSNGAVNVPTNVIPNWTAAPSATHYDVYLGTVNPPPLFNSNQTVTYIVGIPTLPANTQHWWQVVAKAGAQTNAGPIWSFTTGSGVSPNAPSQGVVLNSLHNQLQIGWQDNSNNEDGFNIYRSTDGIVFSLIGNVAANTTSYTDLNLNPNTRYWYRIYSYVGLIE